MSRIYKFHNTEGNCFVYFVGMKWKRDKVYVYSCAGGYRSEKELLGLCALVALAQ